MSGDDQVNLVADAICSADIEYGPNYEELARAAIAAIAAALNKPWMDIDLIIDALDAAGCCKNGYVNAPEDVVARALRDWLSSSPPLSLRGDNFHVQR